MLDITELDWTWEYFPTNQTILKGFSHLNAVSSLATVLFDTTFFKMALNSNQVNKCSWEENNTPSLTFKPSGFTIISIFFCLAYPFCTNSTFYSKYFWETKKYLTDPDMEKMLFSGSRFLCVLMLIINTLIMNTIISLSLISVSGCGLNKSYKTRDRLPTKAIEAARWLCRLQPWQAPRPLRSPAPGSSRGWSPPLHIITA